VTRGEVSLYRTNYVLREFGIQLILSQTITLTLLSSNIQQSLKRQPINIHVQFCSFPYKTNVKR